MRTLSDRAVLGERNPEGRDPIPNYFPAIVVSAYSLFAGRWGWRRDWSRCRGCVPGVQPLLPSIALTTIKPLIYRLYSTSDSDENVENNNSSLGKLFNSFKSWPRKPGQ